MGWCRFLSVNVGKHVTKGKGITALCFVVPPSFRFLCWDVLPTLPPSVQDDFDILLACEVCHQILVNVRPVS